MANPRQAKKRRSQAKQPRKEKQKHKKVHVLGSKLIAENWDKKETLEQNYRRLGLVARPLTIYTSGGVEKLPNEPKKAERRVAQPIRPGRSEGVIKRNEDGTTTIVYPASDDEEDVLVQPLTGDETHVVKELMESAAQPSIPNVRHPTKSEVYWLQQLVDTYGDDYEAMMWDKDLNPMQHTPAQLKRKIKKWRETA